MLKINRKGEFNFSIIVEIVLLFAVIFLILGGSLPIFGSLKNTTQTLSKCSGMGFINGNCIPRTASCTAKFENLGCPSDKPVCCFDKTEGGGGVSLNTDEKKFCLCQDKSNNLIKINIFDSADSCTGPCVIAANQTYCSGISDFNLVKSVGCVSGTELLNMRAACLSDKQELKGCYDANTCLDKKTSGECNSCQLYREECNVATI